MAKQKGSRDYKVGIYVRLSKEDSRAEESISIENQKLMLIKYVKDNNWQLIEIYQEACDIIEPTQKTLKF